MDNPDRERIRRVVGRFVYSCSSEAIVSIPTAFCSSFEQLKSEYAALLCELVADQPWLSYRFRTLIDLVKRELFLLVVGFAVGTRTWRAS